MMIKGTWIIWLALWYSFLAFWVWRYVIVIKSGNAGSSGMKLIRTEEPRRFWLTIVWDGLMLLVMALLPIAILLKVA
jgi:hypothetical protein